MVLNIKADGCLKDYKKQQVECDCETFFRQYDHPFLIFDTAKTQGQESERAFETLCISADQLVNDMQKPLVTTESAQVFRLVNKGANSFQGSLKIGRAINCDFVIPNGAISKLHGYFTKDMKTQTYFLKDADSKNGTYVNNIRMLPGQEKMLKDGDKISFGRQIGFLFFTPQGFYGLLQQVS